MRGIRLRLGIRGRAGRGLRRFYDVTVDELTKMHDDDA